MAGDANHYELLGVAQDATPSEIELAYRNTAYRRRRMQRGVSSRGSLVTDEGADLERAYAALADPASRARYDRSLNRLQPPSVSAVAAPPPGAAATREPPAVAPVPDDPSVPDPGGADASAAPDPAVAPAVGPARAVPPQPRVRPQAARQAGSDPRAAATRSNRRGGHGPWLWFCAGAATVGVIGAGVVAFVELDLMGTASGSADAGASPAPPSSPTPATPTGASAIATAAVAWKRLYVVEPGDGYIRIAERFAVDLDQMLALNGRTVATRLFPGDVLELPSSHTHKVAPGEGYIIIARQYGVALDILLRINNRTVDTPLYPGDILEIP